jgi:hypothetical protein
MVVCPFGSITTSPSEIERAPAIPSGELLNNQVGRTLRISGNRQYPVHEFCPRYYVPFFFSDSDYPYGIFKHFLNKKIFL